MEKDEANASTAMRVKRGLLHHSTVSLLAFHNERGTADQGTRAQGVIWSGQV